MNIPASSVADEPFPYQKTFDAIAAATSISCGTIAVSVIKFREVFAAGASAEKDGFLVKLKTLLTEYNADIAWSCGPCSDMHGIYDEKMIISINDKEVFVVDNSYITGKDIDV